MRRYRYAAALALCLVIVGTVAGVLAMQGPGPVTPNPPVSSYISVNEEDFRTVFTRMRAAKAEVDKRQRDLLASRYDLSDRPVAGVTMSRGKAIQGGVRAKLPAGVTWEALAKMTSDEVREKGAFPAGFMPLPHPNHPEGGMVFPTFHINEVKKQTGRDLTRFDLDFDLPDPFLPEFPAPIYLTAHRRSEHPSLGVSCFDCHQNGSTNGATHLVGDIRPQQFRHRIETPTLRGVNIQRLFGSQRGLKTVEDFTEFEQRAAYFDGDPVIATKKGVNVLERGSQVHFMAEFQELLDFPPAPKLAWDGKLDAKKASAQELHGQEIFFGKGQCASCHQPPYYTDNTMHNLQADRFYKQHLVNGMMMASDGPIKTFPLRGVKDTPPYLHDGRLLTLEDTVEYFNLVLDRKLTEQEKTDVVAFLRTL